MLYLVIYIKQREFQGDPNNDLNKIQKGFSRTENKINADPNKLHKIISAYQQAKKIQKKSAECFQVGNEWLPIYKKYMGTVMGALDSSNIESLRLIYDNFMRHPSTSGLHGMPVDMSDKYFDNAISLKYKKWFLYDSLHRINLWKGMLGDNALLSNLDSPIIGNPYGFYYDDHFIKVCSDYQHYYATRIDELTQADATTRRRFVVELGGGFGGMAYYLIRDASNLTYINFDLPENLALASYYLMHAHPDKKVFLYGDGKITIDVFTNYDVILLPNFEISQLPSGIVDLVFNSYSLAEMSNMTIRCYIHELCKSVKQGGYFLHVNHTRASLVNADNFEIDQQGFKLIYRIPALWNAARNLLMDENEYLYLKIT